MVVAIAGSGTSFVNAVKSAHEFGLGGSKGQIVAGLVSKSKNPADFKILPDALSVEPIACMMRKDDPAFKTAVDNSIKAMVKSGELAKLYDKWFMQPIPPANTKVGLPLSDATKNSWNNPNDKPMEEYAAP